MRRASCRFRGYVPHLDGLRALAVAGVLAHHYVPVPALELGILATGGVRLFFVLSGFLITRILLATPGEGSVISAVGRFYARRALRIVPLYNLVVIVGALVDLPPARELLPWLLTYTANFQAERLGTFAPFWTLAVEEQFYLVWPWLVCFIPRPALRALVPGLIALGPLYRAYALSAGRRCLRGVPGFGG